MKYILVFLSVLFLSACSEKAEIDNASAILKLKNVRVEIESLNEFPWPKQRRDFSRVVSMGMVFTVILPELASETIDFLHQKYQANAWIVRLTQKTSKGDVYLGTVYAPFKGRINIRGNESSPIRSLGVKIYYAAGYPSERFRHFKCPAFGHDKKIAEMKVDGEVKGFELPVITPIPFHEKSNLAELTPASFNGGMSLVGDYLVEIALYDFVNHQLLSNFHKSEVIPKVIKEEVIDMPECYGVRQEMTPPN